MKEDDDNSNGTRNLTAASLDTSASPSSEPPSKPLLELSASTIWLGAAGLLFLPLLYRLDVSSILLVLVLAIALNAIPEARQVIDSFIGNSPSGRHRLAPQAATSAKALDSSLASRSSIYDERPQSDELQYIPLDVGPGLQGPLTHLIALIQRDFISFWYNTSICLSPGTPFPMHAQSLLNSTMNGLVRRVARQDPKEVSIYLFHSASTSLISQIREKKHPASHVHDALKERDELLRKIRRTSEEILLTLLPRSQVASPLVLSLLSEVVSLQISGTIASLGNPDFLNQMIVNHFGEAVKAVKEVQADAKAKEAEAADAPAEAELEPAGSLAKQESSPEVGFATADTFADRGQDPIDLVASASTAMPPALPPRAENGKGKGKARATSVSDQLDADGTTFAASGFPGQIPLANTFQPGAVAEQAVGVSNRAATASRPDGQRISGGASSSSQSSTQPLHSVASSSTSSGTASGSTSGLRSTPSSAPLSPRNTQHSRSSSLAAKQPDRTPISDKTVDEAIEAGVTKLRTFGTKWFTNASKFLDATLPPEEPRTGPSAGNGQSLKGKERERDPSLPPLLGTTPDSPKTASSAASEWYHNYISPNPSRPASIASKKSVTSSAGPVSSGSRRSSIAGIASPASAAPPLPAIPMSSAERCQKILDSFGTASAELRAKQVKALEHSLFSKSPSLLFPEPQDPQLRAILAHHVSSSSVGMSATPSQERTGAAYHDPDLIELSDDFHEYLEREVSGTGEGLMRLWTQLDHFRYMVEVTQPTEQQMQEDALGTLKKSVKQTLELKGLLPAVGENADEEAVSGLQVEAEKSYWTAVETVLLRLAQNPTKDLFEPLQDWILKHVQRKYWDSFLNANPKNLAMSESLDLPHSVVPSTATLSSALPMMADSPTASTSILPGTSSSHRMSRSSSARSTGSRPMSPSTSKRSLDRSNWNLPKDESHDLGDSMAMHDQDEATVSTTVRPGSKIPSSAPAPAPMISTPTANQTADAVTPDASASTSDLDPFSNNNLLASSLSLTNDSSSTLQDSSELAASSATSLLEEPSDMTPPAFTVSLTDLSPPSAFHNNHVKNRRELEFLIAVEVEGSPGYILARKYTEFEKMDMGIKKALPQSGTKTFPRAPLPSTNFQTSENLCRSLESYLEALLKDDRYAASEPVLLFFAKERTDSGAGGPVILQPLVFLGRGVNNIGKGVTGVTRGIGKGGEMAIGGIATGFNQFGKAVTTVPFGLRKQATPTSPAGESGESYFLKDEQSGTPTKRKSSSASIRSVQSANIPDATPITEEAADNQSTANESDLGPRPQGNAPPPLPPRAASPKGYEVPMPPADPVQSIPGDVERPDPPPGFHYTPRKRQTTLSSAAKAALLSTPTTPASKRDDPLPQIEVPSSPVLRGRMSFDELLKKDEAYRRDQVKVVETAIPSEQSRQHLAAATLERSSSEPGASQASSRVPSPAPSPLILNPSEFNNVLSFAMAILEEAYDLVDSTWNFKRGILKVLETLLRTSYASVIKTGVTKLVTTVSQEEFFIKQLDALRESFWPGPDELWWSTVASAQQPERTTAEKEATRKEARRLILLQAPEGLKVSLGPTATAEAFGRLHDALQGPGAERLVSSLILDYLRLLLL